MSNSQDQVNDLVIEGFGMFDDMDSPADRLRKARIAAGYESAAAAARALSVKVPTYQGHENGTTPFPHAAERYARFFRVSVDWLLSGRGDPRGSVQVPVVAYVGAGAELYPVDDHAKGQGLELVTPPPWALDCVAARVQGDSQYPMLRNGWLIFWRRDQDGVPDDCIGALCVVQVRDGPLLVKDLYRAKHPGRFNLHSINAPIREDEDVEWAARVIDIRPT